MTVKKPTDAELRNARADFGALLSRAPPESVWQAFFTSHPFVLSRSLPLRLEPCDILPLGSPGCSEPDFLIYPGSEASATVHGLIELKTPASRIVTTVRRNVLSLTRDADCAVRQLQIYDRDYNSFSPVKRCVSFSNRSHLFIVMGRTEDLLRTSHGRNFSAQIAELLPPQVRLLTFDELLREYESGLPRRSFVLPPVAESFDGRAVEAKQEFLWSRLPGRIRRRDLHALLGGNVQLSISVSLRSPDVFLFHRRGTGFGYDASWPGDDCFHYQAAARQGLGGMNRIVLEAAQNERALRLFRCLGQGELEYEGRFELDPASPYYWSEGADESGIERRALWFRLRPCVGSLN